MQSNSSFKKPTLLEQIDIFGVAIAIRFNTLPSHNTRFGGIVTITIIGIIIIEIIAVLRILFDQATPSVIYSDDYVSQPEQFQIKPDSFNFALGLQDISHLQYQDNTVYKIKATHQSMKKVYNDVTKQFDPVWQYKEIPMVSCTENNFQIDQSKDYFLKAPFKKMYCFKPEELEATIEGEFSASVYQAISIDISECIGSGCASDEIKKKYLQLPTLGVYMSDNIIQIQNKDDPKKAIGKNLFWKSGPQLAKFITLNLVNNYVNSDFGFYGSDVQKKRVVSLSSQKEQVLPRTNEVLYTLVLVYEKNREINYYRKYLKLDEAFSQLGGMFNGLLAVGFLICKPLSKLELNRKLLNSIFNISIDEDNENDKNNLTQFVDKQDSKYSFDNGQDNQNKYNKANRPKSNSISKSKAISSPPSRIRNKSDSFRGETNNIVKDFFRIQFSELQIKLKDYLFYYLSFWNRFITAKQKLINYGTNQLYHQIDIFYIINKLIEVEKLKHLLLNDNQIKLFEYLPRPKLSLTEVLAQENKEKQQIRNRKESIRSQSISEHKQNNQQSFIDDNKKFQKMKNQNEINSQFSAFGQDDKTPLEKAQDAQRAFNQISKNQIHKTKIDEKLIRMLDPKLVNILMDNSFDQVVEYDSEELTRKTSDKSLNYLQKKNFSIHNQTVNAIIEQEEEEDKQGKYKENNTFNTSALIYTETQVHQKWRYPTISDKINEELEYKNNQQQNQINLKQDQFDDGVQEDQMKQAQKKMNLKQEIIKNEKDIKGNTECNEEYENDELSQNQQILIPYSSNRVLIKKNDEIQNKVNNLETFKSEGRQCFLKITTLLFDKILGSDVQDYEKEALQKNNKNNDNINIENYYQIKYIKGPKKSASENYLKEISVGIKNKQMYD